MVDERAGAAGAYTVHALFGSCAEIRDFGILTAEFHSDIRLRYPVAYSLRAGDYFLNERQF